MDDVDFVFVFDDMIKIDVDLIKVGLEKILINYCIIDVFKKMVGVVFEDVFGYLISIDLLMYKGCGICKLDENGIYDGKVLEFLICEDQVMLYFVYQRLVEMINEFGVCEEYCVVFVFGWIVVVYYKYKVVECWFGIEYFDVKF